MKPTRGRRRNGSGRFMSASKSHQTTASAHPLASRAPSPAPDSDSDTDSAGVTPALDRGPDSPGVAPPVAGGPTSPTADELVSDVDDMMRKLLSVSRRNGSVLKPFKFMNAAAAALVTVGALILLSTDEGVTAQDGLVWGLPALMIAAAVAVFLLVFVYPHRQYEVFCVVMGILLGHFVGDAVENQFGMPNHVSMVTATFFAVAAYTAKDSLRSFGPLRAVFGGEGDRRALLAKRNVMALSVYAARAQTQIMRDTAMFSAITFFLTFAASLLFVIGPLVTGTEGNKVIKWLSAIMHAFIPLPWLKPKGTAGSNINNTTDTVGPDQGTADSMQSNLEQYTRHLQSYPTPVKVMGGAVIAFFFSWFVASSLHVARFAWYHQLRTKCYTADGKLNAACEAVAIASKQYYDPATINDAIATKGKLQALPASVTDWLNGLASGYDPQELGKSLVEQADHVGVFDPAASAMQPAGWIG